MNNPNPILCEAFMNLRYHLVGCVSVLCHHNDGAECPESMALMQKVADNDAAVQGNRPRGYIVTWKDLRLLAEGALRICLDHLEKHP